MVGKKTPAKTRTNPKKRRTVDQVAAAEAAKRYRARRKKIGYSALQVWVPTRMKTDLLDIVHAEMERRLALEEIERESVTARRAREESAPRPRRRLG